MSDADRIERLEAEVAKLSKALASHFTAIDMLLTTQTEQNSFNQRVMHTLALDQETAH